MNTWTAPAIVAILGTILGFSVGEPAVGLIAIGIALCGYAINKADNR
jgi:hypothetical protein